MFNINIKKKKKIITLYAAFVLNMHLHMKKKIHRTEETQWGLPHSWKTNILPGLALCMYLPKQGLKVCHSIPSIDKWFEIPWKQGLFFANFVVFLKWIVVVITQDLPPPSAVSLTTFKRLGEHLCCQYIRIISFVPYPDCFFYCN